MIQMIQKALRKWWDDLGERARAEGEFNEWLWQNPEVV